MATRTRPMIQTHRNRPADHQPPSSWLDDLKFDPAKHPEARALVGYVRKRPGSDGIQLFLSLDLNSYYEIRSEDVLDQKTFGDEDDIPRTVVWVDGPVAIRQVRVCKVEDLAQFLGGRLSEQYLRSAAQESPPIVAYSSSRKLTTESAAPTPCVSC